MSAAQKVLAKAMDTFTTMVDEAMERAGMAAPESATEMRRLWLEFYSRWEMDNTFALSPEMLTEWGDRYRVWSDRMHAAASMVQPLAPERWDAWKTADGRWRTAGDASATPGAPAVPVSAAPAPAGGGLNLLHIFGLLWLLNRSRRS